jgi:hypothetical protein
LEEHGIEFAMEGPVMEGPGDMGPGGMADMMPYMPDLEEFLP